MLSLANMHVIRAHHMVPVNVFVETGTYGGYSAERARTQFPTVHTVELDARMYRYAEPRLRPLGVQCHLGDSADIVPRLAKELQHPVFWFLDAHWFDTAAWGEAGLTALVPTPLPLLRELAALSLRPYADVIVIDDANNFGRHDAVMTSEWVGITQDRIASYFEIEGRPFRFVIFDNLAVIYRSGEQE
jgi:hypothetical protein